VIEIICGNYYSRTMRRLLHLLLVLTFWTGAGGATAQDVRNISALEVVAVIRQSCSGYPGPEQCFTSLAAWQTAFGGIDFSSAAPGDLVAADRIAVARIEGAWTQPDTNPLDLSGWVTDDTHYILIYTAPEARHNGTPGSGYRLAPTDPNTQPFYSDLTNFRVEGLEIFANSAYAGHVIYLRPDATTPAGEIRFSHNLIHGDGSHTASGIYNYTFGGVLKIWNNIIYHAGTPGYTAGIQTGAGTAYIYNNTIVDIISGFAIRSGGVVVAKNNLTDAPGTDFYGSFYIGSDFNASGDLSAPGLHSRREQAFTFVNRPAHNYHLAGNDFGARNYGLDLSIDAIMPVDDDIDWQARSGGWDIGADETMTGSDTVVPVRFGGAPSGMLPAATTQTNLSLSTQEAATCRLSTVPGVAYDAMPVTFENTGGLQHTHPVSGLQEEQPYTYFIRCKDPGGNANSEDFAISFTIGSSDAVPPVPSNIQSVDLTPYSAVITWTTDEPASTQMEYGDSATLGSITVISDSLSQSHAALLTGLDPETAYHFRVRSRDFAGNESIAEPGTFTTAGWTGAVYHVNQTHPQASDANPGSLTLPWLTIQHAADMAQPGDTILVHPGDYGRTVITQGGSPGNYITFKGLNEPDQSLLDPGTIFDPQNPVPLPGNPALNAVTKGFDLDPPYPVELPIGYVRIENFEITAIYEAGGIHGRGGVRLADTEYVQIVRNFIHDLNPDPNGYDYIGVRGESHDNLGVVVKDNTLYHVQGTGIGIIGQNWLVEGNYLSHGLDVNTDSGAHVGGDSDAMRFFGSGHIIRGNLMQDYLDEEQYGDPHIDCYQTFSVYPDSQFAHDILIEGNTCDNFGQMLMIEDSSEEAGTGNAVHHITFRNNTFRHARAYAIQGGGADHFTFVNNVIAESNYGGFGLSNNPYLTVYNNIFYNNGSGSQINDEASKIGSVWDNNLHYPDFTWPSKQPEYDQHSLFGIDPQFVDAAAGDYRLKMDSPAIDRGAAQAEFNYDKAGVFRPQLGGWDIGAYEAQPELVLSGSPGDASIHLRWEVNASLPVTATWQIVYTGPAGNPASPITGISGETRQYAIDGLQNYILYTVTLSAMLDGAAFLTDTITIMPTDRLLYLPAVRR
jgi:hypothetical protein